MRNIVMKIMYDGSAFHGWQIQPNGITVQEAAETVLSKLLREKITVTGCSRTDAGVHAKEFYFNFFSDTKIPAERLPFAFNNALFTEHKTGWSGYISAIDAFYANEDFNSRFSSLGKQYMYVIHNSNVLNPFTRNYSWFFPYKLDVEKMKEAAKYFVGRHDFSAFMASGGSQKTTVRNVSMLEVSNSEEWSDEVILKIRADAYLYNMVRIITGTLCEVGCKRKAPEEIPDIIKSCQRKRAGMTAPPEGLFLEKVYYPDGALYRR